MKAVIGFIAFFFFLHFANPVFAAAPSITSYPSETLTLDTAFTVTATMSGLSKNAIYRLRMALAETGTSNYFGSTFDGTSWHYGSINDGNYLSVTTDGNGVWGGNIQGKIDSDDPNFTTGSGAYDLKIGRYTQTGSTAAWSNIVSIDIIVPTPTPIPTDTPTPTPTPTPTSFPTNTPTPIKTPTPTPSHTPTPTPTLKPSITPTTEEILPTDILGESTESGEVASATDMESFNENSLIADKTESSNSSWFQKILIGIGAILLIACAILSFRFYIKNKKQNS